jgi:hypothetical protein
MFRLYFTLGTLEPRRHFGSLGMPRKKPKLIAAARRVAEAARIVAEQRALIARLKASGHPVADAEAALQMYVGALKLLEDHERRMKAENKAKRGETKKSK